MKDEQKDAITAFLYGKDVFVSLPTGSGKLLCIDSQGSRQTEVNLMSILRTAKYFRDTFAAVSLMDDQVARFSKRRIPSTSVTSKEAR